MKKILSILAVTLPLLTATAYAEEPKADNPASSDAIQSIEVDAVKNPLLHPYRALWAGLDAFDKYHQLAPAASLRFRLQKNGDVNRYAIDTEGFSMRIAGNETSIPIPIDTDGTFSMPRNQAALDDNADLILNKKKQLYYVIPDIRTPGIPGNMRRLGDIRLDCRVLSAVLRKELNFALRAGLNNLFLGGDMCESSRAHWSIETPERLSGAIITLGGRRQVLESSRHSIDAPIMENSWSDDALIEMQFAGPPTVEEFAQQPIYLRGSMNKWGKVNPLTEFDATTYIVDIALPKGTHEFRVGSKDGKLIDVGAVVENQEITLGSAQRMTDGGRNFSIKVEQPATFTFKLDVSKPSEPMLTVTSADMVK